MDCVHSQCSVVFAHLLAVRTFNVDVSSNFNEWCCQRDCASTMFLASPMRCCGASEKLVFAESLPACRCEKGGRQGSVSRKSGTVVGDITGQSLRAASAAG